MELVQQAAASIATQTINCWQRYARHPDPPRHPAAILALRKNGAKPTTKQVERGPLASKRARQVLLEDQKITDGERKKTTKILCSNLPRQKNWQNTPLVTSVYNRAATRQPRQPPRWVFRRKTRGKFRPFAKQKLGLRNINLRCVSTNHRSSILLDNLNDNHDKNNDEMPVECKLSVWP